MNERSKKKRQERVRKQKLKERNYLQKETKQQKKIDRLQYLTRMRKTPIVNADDSTLERNIKILEKAMAEQEALKKFQEEHKEEAAKNIEAAKEESEKVSKQWLVTEPEVANIFEETTAGFAPAPSELKKFKGKFQEADPVNRNPPSYRRDLSKLTGSISPGILPGEKND